MGREIIDDRAKRYSLQERQSMIREMMDDRMKRNSREERSFLSDRKSMIRETIEGDAKRSTRDGVGEARRSIVDDRRSENRSFQTTLSERQSGEDRGKMSISPYWDDKSSNSDLSDSYRTAKNSRSVSMEKNNSLEMSGAKNSYSDLSEGSSSYDTRKFGKVGDDFMSNGGERVRKVSVSDVTRKHEGVRREYNRSLSTDRRRFSYMDGTLNSPYSASSRVTDSLRTRRHSKDFSLTSSGSFNERITAKDIEKFRNEFRRTNSCSTENTRLKAGDTASNNNSNENSTSSDGSKIDGSTNLTENNNSNDGRNVVETVDTTNNNVIDGSESKEMSSNQQNSNVGDENCDNLKESSVNEGRDSIGNKKLKNINDEVLKYKKPESPLSFSMKESAYQKPLTNTQYTTRRKSYISSVLDREDGSRLLRSSSRLESNGSSDFRRSISLNQSNEMMDSRGARRSHSVTPDRSVLGKFLGAEKFGESKLSKKELDSKFSVENDVGDSRILLKNRRVSRFLRPDFYDTPREESVYVKNDEEEKNKEVEVKKSKKSRVKETIRSLRESSLPKECDLAISESSLIKRAVSLDDVTTVGSSINKPKTSARSKRASSVSSDRRVILEPLAKIESFIKKKMSTDKRKKKVEDEKSDGEKESVVRRLARRISPKLVKNLRRRSCVGAPLENGGGGLDLSEATLGNGYRVDKINSEVSQPSRATRIANLKKLDFTKPHRSADSTPSFDDYDELSLTLLSPNDDNSDSWSAASDYVDARDFTVSPTSHHSGAEESVSERIRRKSFYSRFNQLKKKKVATNSSTQAAALSPRLTSRLPTYRKSMSASLPISPGSVGSTEQPVDK
ncbi:hypothetical protein LSTR_LSTR007090 [Laodelphax striatellus]|uniref:Uncharacterized protein n=1 Tax=Laodelphax striatellus TaxID=195883 RepID=A0A482WFC9_LAOST|nr:hypothetical protein LSTR_LSTR007090 [Laodelphax striatellus]